MAIQSKRFVYVPLAVVEVLQKTSVGISHYTVASICLVQCAQRPVEDFAYSLEVLAFSSPSPKDN